ncbi:hypothetical protein [Dendrosporobacter sp. 1207_IL3150]|uniref:hypothetical protein n=1 Tax=Dendrosporobacter sp. 1207_IL3150 TaxID=3084054 RepID=UPI002FDAE44D
MSRGIFNQHFYHFREMDNVVGIGRGNKIVRGSDTKQEALIILVRKKIKRNDLQRSSVIPPKMDGMITDVIEVGDICFHSDRKKIMRPAQPGISIGHYKVSAGTFGAVVYDRDTGAPLILSNNHVLANLTDGKDNRSLIGDSVIQPGFFDNSEGGNNVIGTLSKYIPIYRELNSPQCKYAKLFEDVLNKLIGMIKPQYRVQVLRNNEQANIVDCAVAVPNDPNGIISEVLEIGDILGTKDPKIGMTIKKSGRSSGVTQSIILATDVTIRVNVNKYESALFADQILAGPMSMPGDSGSVILSEDNYAVGLLFAGSESATMFNRIDNVLDTLNVRF